MFAKFKYERIPLSLIKLDERNPRIVTQVKLSKEEDIINYLFDHEDLASFMKKIASEGHNRGAERPYVIKNGKEYVVVEGNTRIAAYKLLTGAIKAPEDDASKVPLISNSMKEELLAIDCTVAPSRDALLPIMANAHFGLGDKSKWGYLGSRKAVYDEWQSGKTLPQLASAFDRKEGAIRDLILEYKLYLESLELGWTKAEMEKLLDPAVQFNPPVRFLQTTGHKSAVGVELDRTNLEIQFLAQDSKKKLKHLVKKLVIDSMNGLSATSTYQEVFADFDLVASTVSPMGGGSEEPSSKTPIERTASTDQPPPSGTTPPPKEPPPKLPKGALFSYPATSNNALHKQLMSEARKINANNFPAAATALLRCIVESLLKSIILGQAANAENKLLSLESAIDICLSNNVQLSPDDKRIIKEFKKSHLDYVNLGAHGTIVPNATRLMAARDCIDQFVLRNI